ncbi:helix-turn-helix transcriptional regulator [Methylosinus sp. PW1]|uniref:XRE family transcriptional regulator n=1 Tax=Methylosinus sp. PW1 TaxID=107636 RepID=UPI000AF3BB92|nr:helix-turn-helix transcriptional regulator [Methylosinus sp. PW1]
MDGITNPIIAEIKRRAEAKGHSLTSAAVAAGLSDTTLTKHKNSATGPSIASLSKVAKLLECKVEDFLVSPGAPQTATVEKDIKPVEMRRRGAPRRKDIPVRGTAAGSALNGFEISPNVIEYVHRPPALEGVDDAYAIYVVSKSMIPLHNPGDLRFVHPHRMCKPGDSVIIQIQLRPGAPIEAYIKTFVRETKDEIVAHQFNPIAELKYKKSTIYALHKVLTMNELFGV